MQNYFSAMLRYFEFGGRSTRREYWWFQLGSVATLLSGILIDFNVLGYFDTTNGSGAGPLTLFSIFIHFIPGLTVLVRRLHDAGRSGFWYFIGLVPLIGGFWLLYLTLKGPDDNSDDFGPDPRFGQPTVRFERQKSQTRSQLLMQQMDERRRRMSV